MMKNLKYYIGFSVIAFALSACSDSDELLTEYNNDNLAVHFTTGVGKAKSRATGTDYLASGTKVGISNGGAYLGYVADDNGSLTPTDGDFIRWTSTSQTSMDIKAYTPMATGADAEQFTIPADQSTADNLAAADFMTFVGSVTRQSGSNDVNFELEHRLTQVNIVLSSIDSRYTNSGSDKYTFDVTVYSPSTAVSLTSDSEPTVTGDNTMLTVTPYGGTGIVKDATAKAIIAPASASTDAQFISVQVKKNGTAFGTPLYATGHQELKSGYSYIFNLAVNNEALSVSSVQVSDWQSTALTGGDADVTPYEIDLANFSTEDDLKAEITKAYDSGARSLKVTGSDDNSILGSALSACKSYIYIDLSQVENFTEIPFGTFQCSTLRVVKLPNNITSVGEWAFNGCDALTSVSLPAAISIGGCAFRGCTSLTSVSLPAATSIGINAFDGCTSLETLEVNSEYFVAENNLLFDKDKTKLILAYGSPKSVTLPSSTTEIGEYAFSGCTTLKSVSAPAATSIGYAAFVGCTSLTSVSLPKATSIGDMAFSFCNSLTSVSLPVATSIDSYVFMSCDALTSVSLPAATSIGFYAFSRCKSLTSVSMPKASTFGRDIFNNCTTENIDLVLRSDQQSKVSGTTWTYTYYSTNYSYTFKSITFE